MNENKYTIQSVEKACDLLMVFNGRSEELGASDLSRILGISKSTVWKLLNTFENKGFLVKNQNSDKYSVSIQLFQIACQYYNQVSTRFTVRNFMERLSKKYGETIHFAVRDGDEIVYVEKIDGTFSINIYSRIGRRSPLYAPAVGKVILANLGQEQIADILNRLQLKAYTEKTITSKEALLKALDTIREQGYAVDNEEYELGIRCAGVPIRNIAGRIVGGLSVSGTKSRMTNDLVLEIVKDLKAVSEDITRHIGYND